MRIEWVDLVVCRGPRRVLDGLTLAAEPGEVLAVVGPNGAGKTTLMQATIGLLGHESGRILLDGKQPSRLARRDVARLAAYVPQFYEGYMGFTVADVVASGRYVHLQPLGVPSAEDRQAIRQALAQCDLEGMEDRTVDTLSGGERQKVWLAAAIAQESPGLLLDEPTSSLDAHHQADLVRLIRQLAHGGKTVVVVCHDLNLPAALGAKVAAIKDGKIGFCGSSAEFADAELLAEIFQADFVLARQESTGKAWIALDI